MRSWEMSAPPDTSSGSGTGKNARGFVSEDQVHARPRKPLRPELSEICFGKRVGKRRDWLFEQVKDSRVGGVPERLRQSFKLVPGSVREAKDPVTH